KRVYGSSRTNPKHIHAVFQCQFHVSSVTNFCSNRDIQVMSNDFHPLQAVFSDTFEASWSGSWFPNTGTENGGDRICLDHVQTYFFNLFWGLRTARSCNDHMAIQT